MQAQKWDPSNDGLELLFEGSESHEPAPDIPRDKEIKKEPPDKEKISEVPAPQQGSEGVTKINNDG